MKRVNVLRRLAQGLRTVPPEVFNMRMWGNSRPLDVKSKKFDCGFAGCAIGWLPRFVPNTALVRPGDGPCYNGYYNFEAIAQYFGISFEEATYLFSFDNYNTMHATTTNVANRIELFIKRKEGK